MLGCARLISFIIFGDALGLLRVRLPQLLAEAGDVLAELVANLYDSVQSRVNSQEWKSLGLAAEGRRKELKEVESKLERERKELLKKHANEIKKQIVDRE